MSDIVIKAENIGKKFIITHQQAERYTALRDIISSKAKSFLTQKSALNNNTQTKEEFWALKDISFEIEQGDRVGIIGRNGAGKSTLLKVLSRITEPTKGRMTLKGRVASLLEVGTGFHPELTGRENVFLNGAILGMSRAEINKKFDEIIDFAEIEKFLDTPVKRYSSGMYVRLAFAIAAHLEPEILIVDEVLAVGDAQFQKKCLGKMEDVSKNEGRTVLFVSHNISVIKLFCSTGIVLEKGQIKSSGNINSCISSYRSLLSTSEKGPQVLQRTTNTGFCFTKVELLDAGSNIIETPTLGDKVIIRAKYQSKIPLTTEYLSFDFTIKDLYRQPVATFISDEMICNFSEFSTQGEVNCEINSLLLRAGVYYIRVSACYNGTSKDSVLDDFEDAVEFNIITTDLNGIGRVLREGNTTVLPARFSSNIS